MGRKKQRLKLTDLPIKKFNADQKKAYEATQPIAEKCVSCIFRTHQEREKPCANIFGLFCILAIVAFKSFGDMERDYVPIDR
jgi:hypothetical protein